MSRKPSTQGMKPFRNSERPAPSSMTGPMVLIINGEGDNELSKHLRNYATGELERYLQAVIFDDSFSDAEDLNPRLIYVPGPGTKLLREVRIKYPKAALVFFGDLKPGDIADAVNAGANSLLPIQSLNEHMVYLSAVEAMQRAENYHASVDVRVSDFLLSSKDKTDPDVMALATMARELCTQVDNALLHMKKEPTVRDIARLEQAKGAVLVALYNVEEGTLDIKQEATKHLKELRTDREMTLDEATRTIRATIVRTAEG